MPPLDANADDPDPATWKALRELLDANDQWRAAYQKWVRSSSSSSPRAPSSAPEAAELRDAQRRVTEARAKMSELGRPLDGADKAWSGH